MKSVLISGLLLTMAGFLMEVKARDFDLAPLPNTSAILKEPNASRLEAARVMGMGIAMFGVVTTIAAWQAARLARIRSYAED